MRSCWLFGKPYLWVRGSDGALELEPLDLEPVRAPVADGVSYEALMAELGRIEDGNVGR